MDHATLDTMMAVQSVEKWIVYAWVFHPAPEKQLRQLQLTL